MVKTGYTITITTSTMPTIYKSDVFFSVLECSMMEKVTIVPRQLVNWCHPHLLVKMDSSNGQYVVKPTSWDF